MSEEQIFEEARKRVKLKQDFYKHLVVYLVVNITLILVWKYASGGGYPWFIWVVGGWGIGLVLNFFDAFIWSQRKGTSAIEKEAEKIRREQR